MKTTDDFVQWSKDSEGELNIVSVSHYVLEYKLKNGSFITEHTRSRGFLNPLEIVCYISLNWKMSPEISEKVKKYSGREFPHPYSEDRYTASFKDIEDAWLFLMNEKEFIIEYMRENK